jgi:hypothetical protein
MDLRRSWPPSAPRRCAEAAIDGSRGEGARRRARARAAWRQRGAPLRAVFPAATYSTTALGLSTSGAASRARRMADLQTNYWPRHLEAGRGRQGCWARPCPLSLPRAAPRPLRSRDARLLTRLGPGRWAVPRGSASRRERLVPLAARLGRGIAAAAAMRLPLKDPGPAAPEHSRRARRRPWPRQPSVPRTAAGVSPRPLTSSSVARQTATKAWPQARHPPRRRSGWPPRPPAPR